MAIMWKAFKKLSYANQKNGRTELLVIYCWTRMSVWLEILTEISMLTAHSDLFFFLKIIFVTLETLVTFIF